MSANRDTLRFEGTTVAPGYALGTARVVDVAHFPAQVPRHKVPENDVKNEINRLHGACAEARKELEELADRVEEEVSRREAEMVRPQAAMAEDPTFIAEAEELITEQNLNAEAAVAEVMDRFEHIMESLDDEYLRERSTDVRDAGRRILSNLLFVEGDLTPDLSEPCVVISSHLVPSLTVHLERENILAFATERGGYTSHAAILARSLGIPAVTGLEGITEEVVGGEKVVVDGQKGLAILNPSEEELETYREYSEKYQTRRRKMEAEEEEPAVTTDGTRIVVQGNIGRPADLDMAVEHTVEGIGLYRTEFNYLSRSALPDEDRVAQEYGRAAAAFGEDGVVLRVLDIGGDKFPPSIPLAHEENPFLGPRGLRLLLQHKNDLMLPQLRAMLRASERGKVSVLYPMVTSVEEVKEARDLFQKARRQVEEAGHDIRDEVQQGIMVEVPSCLPILSELLELSDFATVGTNDLVQYALAADRNSERMVDVYDPYYPSILRMLKQIIDTARECETEMSVCGEIAGDLEYLPVLIGLGYRKFSVNLQAVARLRHLIRTLSVERSAELAERVVQVATREEVHELTAEFSEEVGG